MMKKQISLLVFCSLCVVMVFSEKSRCNFAPSVWCSSDDIAVQCGVLEACQSYNSPHPSQAAAKLNFTMYYESLCPDSQSFVVKQFYPAFQALQSIVNFDAVPYGNAKERFDNSSRKWVFTCQHGPKECEGNLMETCAIHYLKNASAYIPFINCMISSKDWLQPEIALKDCTVKHNLIWDAIWHCTRGALGNSLQHSMAQRTDMLNPKHTFVPWVTLNGVHTDAIQQQSESNLIKLLCDSYQGTSKPPTCNSGNSGNSRPGGQHKHRLVIQQNEAAASGSDRRHLVMEKARRLGIRHKPDSARDKASFSSSIYRPNYGPSTNLRRRL